MTNDEWIIGLSPVERALIIDLLLEARDHSTMYFEDIDTIQELLARLS